MVNQSGARDQTVERLTASMLALARSLRSLSHREVVSVDGVRRSDIPLLRNLTDHGPMRPGELAERLGVGPSVVSRQLTSLVADQLVTRRTDPADARADLIDITDVGRARVAELWTALLGFMAERVHDWDEPQLSTLAHLLGQLNDSLNACPLGTDSEDDA